MEKEAEAKIQEWFQIIFGKGNWELVNIELADYKKATEYKKLFWEDAVQYQCACKVKDKIFITQNVKDFEKSDLNAHAPQEFEFK